MANTLNATEETSGANEHIKEFLTYYISLRHSPGYAVMINGAWGIGKTYLIKDFLAKNADKIGSHAYVSLYGLTNIDEIEGAVFEALYPALGWKATKVGARIAKAALKKFGLDPELKASDLASKFQADLFIFDDLERCEAPINKSLGYINQFVEHDGCKVIILANEAEIRDGEYRQRREKLIGKSLEVQSSFHDAFSHFVSQIDNQEAKRLFERSERSIEVVYQQSGLNNLRILQQTMWDFERFFCALAPEYQGNSKAVLVVLDLLFALSFELRSGRIAEDDLAARLNKLVLALSKRDGEVVSALASAGKRYPEINLNDTTLSDAVLVEFLVRGIVDRVAISQCLEKSRYFISPKDEPSWQTVWHWFERTNDQFLTAFQKMEAEFANREFIVAGVILHVIGLRLFLARIGLLKSVGRVIAEGRRYIDDVYASGRLEPLETDESREFRSGGFDGLGIHEHDTPEYLELLQYLQQKRKKAAEDKFPEKAARLLKGMEEDPDLYARRLRPTGEDGSCSHIPLLASIAPEKFAAMVLNHHPANQRTILSALHSRYEHGMLQRELAPETEWLRKVRKKLIQMSKKLPPIGKYRLQESIETSIDGILPDNVSKTSAAEPEAENKR